MHLALLQQHPEPVTPRRAHRRGGGGLRAMFGAALLASILMIATGCNKHGEGGPRLTSLADKPRVALLLFGDRGDPRVLPLATLTGGQVTPLNLDSAGWRAFDKQYFATGAKLSLYQDGKAIGDAAVRRGMWDGDSPLYKLPRCRNLRPLAAVSLESNPHSAVMLELLAVSDPLPVAPPRSAVKPADIDSAKALASRVAQHEGFTNTARSELDLLANAIQTGATSHPTLTGSYIERGSGVTGKPRHIFAIGDWSEEKHAYVQSFVHVPSDSAREFRRLIDHLDLTGDGVDEIVLEGWRNGGDSYLIFMQYRDGHWREIARGANDWCADPAK